MMARNWEPHRRKVAAGATIGQRGANGQRIVYLCQARLRLRRRIVLAVIG